MTQKENSTASSTHQLSFAKPVLIGAAVGLVVISIFVFGVDQPNPAWGKFWMVQPLIVTPLVGASGGLFYYIMVQIISNRGLNRVLAIVIGAFGFIVAQWLGIVLGLNGTMWN
jgi:hypothetical protein